MVLQEEFSASSSAQKLRSEVHVETGYVNSVTSTTYTTGWTGGLRGQESQPKSLALNADHFRSIFVPPSCDFGFEPIPSDLRITS